VPAGAEGAVANVDSTDGLIPAPPPFQIGAPIVVGGGNTADDAPSASTGNGVFVKSNLAAVLS